MKVLGLYPIHCSIELVSAFVEITSPGSRSLNSLIALIPNSFSNIEINFVSLIELLLPILKILYGPTC